VISGFQRDAFQNNAFQIGDEVPAVVVDRGAGGLRSHIQRRIVVGIGDRQRIFTNPVAAFAYLEEEARRLESRVRREARRDAVRSAKATPQEIAHGTPIVRRRPPAITVTGDAEMAVEADQLSRRIDDVFESLYSELLARRIAEQDDDEALLLML